MYKPLVMSNAEYHSKKDYESSSSIRDALLNPKKYIFRKTHETVPTKSMEEGTAVHSYFLENDKFKKNYVFKPKAFNGRTKEGKEWMQEHGHLNILGAEWEENLIQMNHNFLNSPAKFIYDNEGLAELSFFWDDIYKIKGKCRPDWLSVNGNTVVDLKTTKDASPKSFQRSISEFGYHIQAAWYLRGLRKLDIPAKEFIFIAIEKTAPYCIGVYRADEDMINAGMSEVEKSLEVLKMCQETKLYPDYTPTIQDISLPPWMTNKKVTPQNYQEIELY